MADPRAPAFSARVVLPGLTLGPIVPRVTSASVRVDLYFGGRYRIVGDVAIDDTPDVPVRRQVRLFDKVTARLVRETWSAPGTGAYAFDYIANGRYFVVTHDYLTFYNAVVADNLTPELMP